MKKFRVKILGKTQWMAMTCDQRWVESNEKGYPDYSKKHKCDEWATKQIHWRGASRPNHYCEIHAEEMLGLRVPLR